MTGARDPERVDRAQLGALLRTIFRVRTRGRRTFGRGRPRGLIFLVVIYAVMGALAGAIAFLDVDVFTFATILGGMSLLIAGMSMVAESSQLLFSAQEHDIVGHRPINARTLLLARALSLVGLTLLLTLSLNLAPMFMGLAAHGAEPWLPLAHLVSITLLSVFAAGAVVFVYVLLTRLIGRERFDAVASWLQLGVSVVFIFGYQIIPRLIDRAHGFRIAPALPWLMLLPPAWFAALETLLAGRPPAAWLPHLLPMAAIGIGLALALAYAAIVRLSGDYARRLASLSEAPGGKAERDGAERASAERAGGASAEPAAAAAPRRSGAGSAGFARALRTLLPDPVERASFRLAAAYMRRDRDVRMRLYPSLASYLVFPIIAFVDPAKGAFAPLASVVMASMLPTATLMTLKMSPQFAAADVFRYAPLSGTASVFHGVRKAAIVFMTLPVLVISAVLLLLALHDRSWLLATLPAVILMPTLSLADGLAGDYLPLSIAPVTGRQGAVNVWLNLMTALLALGLTVAGWYARRHGWYWGLIGAEVVLVAGLHFALLRGIRARKLAPLE